MPKTTNGNGKATKATLNELEISPLNGHNWEADEPEAVIEAEITEDTPESTGIALYTPSIDLEAVAQTLRDREEAVEYDLLVIDHNAQSIDRETQLLKSIQETAARVSQREAALQAERAKLAAKTRFNDILKKQARKVKGEGQGGK